MDIRLFSLIYRALLTCMFKKREMYVGTFFTFMQGAVDMYVGLF